MDPAAPARRAAFRHARRKGTTRSNQKQELPTTGQTPKAHGIGPGLPPVDAAPLLCAGFTTYNALLNRG